MQPFEHLLHFNSELLSTFLHQLEEAEATDTIWLNQKRSPASLMAHLLASRGDLLARFLGEQHAVVRELRTWGNGPARRRAADTEPKADVEALKTAWALSARTFQNLHSASDSLFPQGNSKEWEDLAFLVWHEIYHIGQLGLLRDVSKGPASMRQAIFDVRGNLTEGEP